ncbi:MAG: AzlD domain-containing protein [Alphaproteobacteria bacterium]|nr:AzlD domain-containing protein [Alphaproteobacteria bacterium]
MSGAGGDPSPWVILALCVAGTYLWRGLGVALSGRIDPYGAVFRWVGCVAYAMLAGLISRMIVSPVGPLAQTGLADRLAGCAVAVALFFLLRRNLVVGVAGGVTATMLLATYAR